MLSLIFWLIFFLQYFSKSYVCLVPVGLFCHSCFNLCSLFNRQTNLEKCKQLEKIAKNSKCIGRGKTSEKRDIQLLLSLIFLFLGCFWGEVSNSLILNDIGRNFLLGSRKKIAKCLMKTFTCRSSCMGTVLYSGSLDTAS